MGHSPRKKKDAAFRALRKILDQPGSLEPIWDELLEKDTSDPKEILARALSGKPEYDDRAAAIIFGAVLEQTLEQAIASHFVTSDEGPHWLFANPEESPLSNFAGKITIGLALGVYEHQMRDDIRWISRIRNTFAHARVHVDFSMKGIARACDELTLPKRGNLLAEMMNTPRKKFSGTVALISGYLAPFSAFKAQGPVRYQGDPLYRKLYAVPDT